VTRQETNRFATITSYVTFALLISSPGVFFCVKAFSMHLYRQRKLDHGFGVFDVPGTGMSIDAYIRWMLVFSVPFIVFSFYILYRLIIRLKHGDVHPAND
jgi:hypothetical protein